MDTCLKIKSAIQNEKIENFLAETIEPPPAENVTASVEMLTAIGAIDTDENITEFGRFALALPVDIKYAKAILYSIGFRCLETVTFIISMLSSTMHFKIGRTNIERAKIKEKMHKFQASSVSDYQVLWKIYAGFINEYEKHDYCRSNFLSFTSMDMAHNIFTLIKTRLATLQYPHTRSRRIYGSINVNGENWQIIHMCLAASLYPNLCQIVYNDNNNHRELRSRFNETVGSNELSVVRESVYKIDDFVVYDQKSLTTDGPVVKNQAMVPAIVVLLVCGHNLRIDLDTGIVAIGEFYFKIDTSVLGILMETRQRLDEWMCAVIRNHTTFNITHEKGRELAWYLCEITET